MSASSGVLEAIAALRSGRPVRIVASTQACVASVETTSSELLDLRDPNHRAKLAISGHRAAALKLGNEREAADPKAPVIVERSEWLDSHSAKALVDPGRDFDRGPIGPLHPVASDDFEVIGAALILTRWAALLPALWLIEPLPSDPSISLEAIVKERDQPTLELVARSKLPLEGMPSTQILVFRASDDGQEHVALLVGAFSGNPPVVRLHSECLTGDVFGSLKCDCGAQLKDALRIINGAGGGVLLYLRQEGRGSVLPTRFGLTDSRIAVSIQSMRTEGSDLPTTSETIATRLQCFMP